MASEYDRCVVQLQDGRELHLKNAEWGTALRGVVTETGRQVTIKAENIAVLINDVSEKEYQQYVSGNKELLAAERWDSEGA